MPVDMHIEIENGLVTFVVGDLDCRCHRKLEKMKSRRNFIKASALAGAGILTFGCKNEKSYEPDAQSAIATSPLNGPVFISTWIHGLEANDAANAALKNGGSILDAVEAGVRVVESDPENTSVGIGGYPDRDGNVTLDACIMDSDGNCGSVAFLQNIENPISVARKVMEETKHIMLVGEGAKRFALEKGFVEKDLRTEKAMKQWDVWRKLPEHQPEINIENHDTIGLLGMDANGKIAGACTTSGAAMKIHGRVGDSPIIGAGLFIDQSAGGACATGVGEEVIRIAGSAMVVELMRNGKTPEEACKEVVYRIIDKKSDLTNIQVGFIAMNTQGETGGYSIYSGFNYAKLSDGQNKMVDVQFDRNWE